MFWNNKRNIKVQIAKDCTIDLKLDKVETLDSFRKKTAVLENVQNSLDGKYKTTVRKVELEPVQTVTRATTTKLIAPIRKRKKYKTRKKKSSRPAKSGGHAIDHAPVDTNLIKRPRNDNCIATSEYLDVIRLGETVSISDVVKRVGLRQTHKNLNKVGVALYKLKYAKILIQDEPAHFTRLQ